MRTFHSYRAGIMCNGVFHKIYLASIANQRAIQGRALWFYVILTIFVRIHKNRKRRISFSIIFTKNSRHWYSIDVVWLEICQGYNGTVCCDVGLVLTVGALSFDSIECPISCVIVGRTLISCWIPSEIINIENNCLGGCWHHRNANVTVNVWNRKSYRSL